MANILNYENWRRRIYEQTESTEPGESEFINEDRPNWLDTGEIPDYTNSYFKDSSKVGVKNDKMRIDDTNKYKILKFIYKSGHQGVRYTDIVKYIIEKLLNKPGKYDYKTERGYYASALNGTYDRDGILPSYCTKNENGKWVLTNRKLIDYFNDLKDRGELDEPWRYREAKKKGMNPDETSMYDEWDILNDIVKNK